MKTEEDLGADVIWHLTNVVHTHQHMNIQKIQWREQQDGQKDVKKHI